MPTYLKTARTKSFADSSQDEVRERVQGIVADIRRRGDEAVREYAETFDHWAPESLRLSPDQIDALIAGLPPQVVEDILF
ncbi:MAG: histidinol dehydrogenase, partial [Friedmanniella sp.]|nr:histidinol dehydrogenase [Friedmanniella sp.]